jgi:hypothetical protein
MYLMYSSTLIFCGWAHGCNPYTVTPMQVGAKECWKMGVWVNPKYIVVSWLRLQDASDCITHPYWMYVMCFSTLIC